MANPFPRYVAIVLALVGLCPSPFSTPARGQAGADAARPVLRVAYFVPNDREPEPDSIVRLDRVLTDVQRFYREGMRQNGYGPMTFELDRDPQGAVRIHVVRGQDPMHAYGRGAAGTVRREVKAALAKDGLDIEHETLIVFQVLLEWQGDKAVEIGPYVGSGSAHSGTAFVYDDARLDPRLLPSKQPGGFYQGPCSLGAFNTHYIGGVAHELGHGLGLPHECERDSERPRKGRSIMGAGNHTYGQELRDEGSGAFLTPAAALPLSVHPLFTGTKRPPAPLTCQLTDLTAAPDEGKLTMDGRVQGGPRSIGMVAYNDPRSVPGDYDASGWTCPVDTDGRFHLVIDDLKPGDYDLRLHLLGEGGDDRYFALHYQVDQGKRPDVGPLLEAPLLREALTAFRAKNQKRLTELVEKVKTLPAVDADLLPKMEHLQRLISPSEPCAAADLPLDVKVAHVADLKMEAMTVGWGKPLRNQVLPEGDASVLLEAGGTFFESGLYAHAPARHALRLDGGWKTLTTRFGLQDRHDGSVVFVVKGDGKELYHSPRVGDHTVRGQTISVAGIALLELLVEDAGDGSRNDWGVWLDPQLRR